MEVLITIEVSANSTRLWLGGGCLAYDTFHVEQVFNACLEVL